MNLSTIIFIIGLLGAVAGVKKPWMGGAAGLIVTPLLYSHYISSNLTPLIVVTLIGFLLSTASGFIGSILCAGLKGKGRRAGTTYVSGFGVHHPGGMVFTRDERNCLKNNDVSGGFVRSY